MRRYCLLAAAMLVGGLCWAPASAQSLPPSAEAPDLLSAVADAVGRSDDAALLKLVGPSIPGYAPKALGVVDKKSFTPAQFIRAVAGCSVTIHHRWAEGGLVDWTCGPAPAAGDKCGPPSYRMRIIGSSAMIIVQNILAPDPCDIFQASASLVVLMDEPVLLDQKGGRGALEWPNPVVHQRRTTTADLTGVDLLLERLLGRETAAPGTEPSGAEWKILYNDRADWLDGSFYRADASFTAFQRTLAGCTVMDRIALKALPVLKGASPFGVSFKCPDRGNSYPLVFMTLILRDGVVRQAYLFPDQPRLVYAPAKR